MFHGEQNVQDITYLNIDIRQFVVEYLVRVHLHQLHLMVPAPGILNPIRQV
jgi:hypothetical protein